MPHKGDWDASVPCDIIGCDGKRCREYEKKKRVKTRL
jgi:hypothetical protein